MTQIPDNAYAGLKAISIRQPWVHAILHCGKDIENRSWATRYRGPVLIHASKDMTRAEFTHAQWDIRRAMGENAKWLDRDALQFGGIAGRAEIVDCVSTSDSPWFFGPYGFVLRKVEALPFLPCKGSRGFFTPDLETALLPA